MDRTDRSGCAIKLDSVTAIVTVLTEKALLAAHLAGKKSRSKAEAATEGWLMNGQGIGNAAVMAFKPRLLKQDDVRECLAAPLRFAEKCHPQILRLLRYATQTSAVSRASPLALSGKTARPSRSV